MFALLALLAVGAYAQLDELDKAIEALGFPASVRNGVYEYPPNITVLSPLVTAINGSISIFGCATPGGELKPAIGLWKELSVLVMTNCGIKGSIPTEIGQLTNLYKLNLANNALEGTLPTELGALPELVTLDLTGNDFTGTADIFTTDTKITRCSLMHLNPDEGNCFSHCPSVCCPTLKRCGGDGGGGTTRPATTQAPQGPGNQLIDSRPLDEGTAVPTWVWILVALNGLLCIALIACFFVRRQRRIESMRMQEMQEDEAVVPAQRANLRSSNESSSGAPGYTTVAPANPHATEYGRLHGSSEGNNYDRLTPGSNDGNYAQGEIDVQLQSSRDTRTRGTMVESNRN